MADNVKIEEVDQFGAVWTESTATWGPGSGETWNPDDEKAPKKAKDIAKKEKDKIAPA